MNKLKSTFKKTLSYIVARRSLRYSAIIIIIIMGLLPTVYILNNKYFDNKKNTIEKVEDDLKNLKVGVQSGTTQADYVTNKLGITSAKQLKRVPDLMMDLQNGNIDVIVTGKNVANINIGQYDGLAIGKTTVGQEVAESTAAAIKKSTDDCDNTSLVKSINDTIKRLKDDNKMDGYMQDALKLAEEN